MVCSTLERRIRINLTSHIKNKSFRVGYDENSIKLPGPAYWWPDEYDLREHGFEVDVDVENAKQAYQLTVQGYSQ